MFKNYDLSIHREAVFSDETPLFRYPLSPKDTEGVTVRLRTLHEDIDSAEVISSEGIFSMELEKCEGMFDYYQGMIPASREDVSYCFRIHKDEETLYYSKTGISHIHHPAMDFIIFRDFETPKWYNGAVLYQIYVDRFYNGDTKNDVQTGEYIYLGEQVKKIENWQDAAAGEDVRSFYGGDLKGVIEKLGYLKKLGIEGIYLNPIFVSPSNHKYDIQDYEHIDPHIGTIVCEEGSVLTEEESTNQKAGLYVSRTTNEANLLASDAVFIELVEKAHEKGIKVIIDGVFNHCGAFHRWLDRENIYGRGNEQTKGAFWSKESPYFPYFRWNADEEYEGWWGHANHPKLHYENSRELLQYILEIARKWVAPPFNADGWRVDVAADLGFSEEYNHYFWQEFRKAVKDINPEAVIVAEHYGNPASWLKGDQWDTVMNYDAFMEPITYFFTGMEKHSDDFKAELKNNGKAFGSAMTYHMAKLPFVSLMGAMNQLSNHDHSRFLTRTNEVCGRVEALGLKEAERNIDMAVLRLGVMVQMTWIGSPTIYYGDEAGLCGFTDPDNRRPYPWGKEDIGCIQYHQQLIRIRRRNSVLKTGSTLFLVEEYGMIAYGRFNEKEKVIVAVNNLSREQIIRIPAWRIGVSDEEKMVRLYMTYEDGFGVSGKSYTVKNGFIEFIMLKKSGVILSNGN